MKTFRPLTALCIVLCVLAAVVPSAAGTFKDSSGGSHPWTIDDGHTLVWEGTPYLPFGVIFEPRYLTVAQTDENLSADQQDISAFKLAGVTDIIIRPSKGLTTVPVAALQKIIDLLDSNGMRYGLELFDPDYAPLVGYAVQPMVNRVDNIMTSGEFKHNLPGTDQAIYALCDARTGEVRDYGRKVVADGQISTPIVLPTAGPHVMLYYPKKAISGGGLFDVWKGFDQHRDSLIVYLKQVKFGKGLRLFIDPFGENFGSSGDADTIVPISTAFRFEYAAWLSKKYTSPGDLDVAWGILKHDINTFDEATRLIPLWRNGRGAAAIYDDSMSKSYPADASKSAIWSDLQEFKAASIRGYMDDMADVAKRISADVPVIYSANALDPIYQTSGPVGYDGLIMPDADNNQMLVQNSGQALSLAENSSRKTWLVTHLRPAGGVYGKKQDLFGAMNTAHDLGAKGFFVDDARGTGVDGADLVSWLAEYAGLSGKDKAFAAYKPHAVYYPRGITYAGIKRMTSGTWWLPCLDQGQDLPLGVSLAGYAVIDAKTLEPTICIWSRKGTQLIHLVSQIPLTVTRVVGGTAGVKPKKGRVELQVGDEPVFIHGVLPDQFMPVETAMESLTDFQNAVARGEQKHMDVSDYKDKIKSAQAMINGNQLSLALDLIHESSDELNLRLKGLATIPSMGSDGTGR